MSKKKEPRYLRGDGKGKGKTALVIFLIAAVACEAVLIRGAMHSDHPLMMGIMIAVITLVFAFFAVGIVLLNKASQPGASEDAESAAPAKNTGAEAPSAVLANSGDAKADAEPKKSITVAAAVIRRGDKIFATQRGYGDYRGWWEFPGGKLEAWERPREACKREIREELAIDIKVGDEIAVVNFEYPEFYLEMHCFLCELMGEEPKLLEHDAGKWVSKVEWDGLKWLEADLDVLDKLKEIL